MNAVRKDGVFCLFRDNLVLCYKAYGFYIRRSQVELLFGILMFLGVGALWLGVIIFKLVLLYFLFNWIDKLFDKYGD